MVYYKGSRNVHAAFFSGSIRAELTVQTCAIGNIFVYFPYFKASYLYIYDKVNPELFDMMKLFFAVYSIDSSTYVWVENIHFLM